MLNKKGRILTLRRIKSSRLLHPIHGRGVFQCSNIISNLKGVARALTLRREKTDTNELAQHIGSPRRGAKGKILRIKQGYNPNSSSMGSIVFVLPAILLVITVIFGALSGLFASILGRSIDDRDTRTGRLYIKLQNLFFKRKIKENVK